MSLIIPWGPEGRPAQSLGEASLQNKYIVNALFVLARHRSEELETPDQCPDRVLEQGRVERPGQPHCRGQIIDGVPGCQLVLEPQPLLSEGNHWGSFRAARRTE